MDWREFIASLVGSLAWPGAVVLVVWILREQFKALLGEPLKRLAVGPVELEWDRTLAATRSQVQALPAPPNELKHSAEAAAASPGGIVADLWPIAETAPSAAVLEGFSRVEQALVRRLGGVMDEVPHVGGRQLARLGREHDVITDATLRAIDGLVVLRNLAAHRRGDEKITSAEAGEYLSLVEAVLYSIVSWVKPDNPDDPDGGSAPTA